MDAQAPLSPENVAAPPKVRKTFWETVLTTTPVLMTVVATLLAGLSSSEMTQAQYHRSLAAQQQSKAGDQWGYFQAKRIRGSGLEQTADLLHPSEQPLGRTLPAIVARVRKHLQAAERQTEQFLKLAGAGGLVRVEFVPSKRTVQEEGEKLLQALRDSAKKAGALQDKIAGRLESSQAKLALSYLGTDALPATAAQPPRTPAIEAACNAIRNRQPASAVGPLVKEIQSDDLQDAIVAAEARAAAFDRSTAPVTRAIDELGSLVKETAALAHAAYHDCQGLASLADFSSADDGDPLAQALARLARTAVAAKSAADELRTDFKAARHNFKARCYEWEARQNQAIAELYELQVRIEGTSSERHRQRSKNFFYGMLTAQAGVVIASLSLAMHRKSVLWAVASAAGLTAIGFGSYVYLCM